MSNSNLCRKLCPCCGCESSMNYDDTIFYGQIYDGYPEGHNHGWRIECEGPKCHLMTCWWHTEEEAVTAWNARAEPKVKPENVLDAAHDYLIKQYVSSPLAHPVDRKRILSALKVNS